MKYSDIPVIAPSTKNSDEALQISEAAPRYLQSVIEDTRSFPLVRSLADLKAEQVNVLTGGQDAATYLLLKEGKGVIVKFGYSGLNAEVEALGAWKERGVHVPRVETYGIVPATRGSRRKVHYIVEEAMVDMHGRLAETCDAFLRHSPDKARRIGELMGRQLHKMHGCISERSFGDFADSQGNTAPYGSWNAYLLGYLETQDEYLQQQGFSAEQLTGVRRFIEKCQFESDGRYLHGDFSVRNTAILPHKAHVIIFDPNPVIGDPSWDIAVLYNNREFAKRRWRRAEDNREKYNRENQLLIGFQRGYEREIVGDNVLTGQLIQGLLHMQFHETRLTEGSGEKIDFEVRRDAVLEFVERMYKRVAHGQ